MTGVRKEKTGENDRYNAEHAGELMTLEQYETWEQKSGQRADVAVHD